MKSDSDTNQTGRKIICSDTRLVNADENLFEGTYDKLPVMVKKTPVGEEGFEERMHLHRLCEHGNIIRVYAVEADNVYYYTALEKCDYSLEHYYLANDMTTRKKELLKLFTGINSGLIHLNRKSIIHGNLKPSNVMIKRDGNALTAKIYGLEKTCKKLEDGEDTRADMRDLGLTLFSCLTHDKDFVKLNREDQENGINTKLEEFFSTYPEAYDIISRLVNYRCYPRLSYNAVCLHTIFWAWRTRLRFLVDVSEVLQMVKDVDINSPILKDINGLGILHFTKKWKDEINKDWYESMKLKCTDDVFGLLKLIRETYSRILEVKKPADWDRERLENHITECYPTLLMNIHSILKLHFRKNKILKVYFEDCL